MSRGFWVAIGLVAFATFGLWSFASPAARSASPEPQPVRVDHQAEFQKKLEEVRRQARNLNTWAALIDTEGGHSSARVCRLAAKMTSTSVGWCERASRWNTAERCAARLRRRATFCTKIGSLTQHSLRRRDDVVCTPPFKVALALNRAALYLEEHPEVMDDLGDTAARR